MNIKFLYISILALFLANFSNAQVPPLEKAALQALYTVTGGSNWTNNTNWNSVLPVNDWYGITVLDGHISKIVLNNNNLVGPLPSELGVLSNLIELQLYDNSLYGNIPNGLGGMSSLQYFYMHRNQLTGSIPSDFGNLSSLTRLYLSDNNISGVIPSSFGDLTNLQYLYLHHNQLTGNIPDQLGDAIGLRYLLLNNNNLSGAIPSTLGGLSNLITLQLNHNQLSGAIPSTIGSLSNLNKLFLEVNPLTGSIPPELGNLSSLEQLNIYTTQISGIIPPEFGNLQKIRNIRLWQNNLTGPIPDEFGDLSTLTSLQLYNNKLSGDIPSSLLNLNNFVVFQFQNNNFKFVNFESEHIAYTSKFLTYTYSPQAKVDLEETVNVIQGSSYTFNVFTDDYFSTNNTYQWYDAWDVPIADATSRTYTIPNVILANQANYYCKVNNTVISGLTLERNPIHFFVQEAPCTYNNANSDVVEGLFIDLLSHLVTKLNNNEVIPEGYTSPELYALTPYITDVPVSTIGIYNIFTYYSSYQGSPSIATLKFSFSPNETEHDVVLNGNIFPIPAANFDLNLNSYTSSSAYMDLSGYDYMQQWNGGDEIVVFGFKDFLVRHINFCPDEIVSCTVSNPNSEVVEDLFLNLVQHLTARVQNNDPIASINGSSPPELIALLPYITDPDKGVINNFTTDYIGNLRFSFSPNENTPDVIFATHTLPTVNLTGVDIDLSEYSDSNVLLQINQLPLFDKLLFKHINFCPDEIFSCTVSNPNSDVVKQLYLNLLNHFKQALLADPSLVVPDGYNPPEMQALAPYIIDTDVEPKIYNFYHSDDANISAELFHFSFSPDHETVSLLETDVIVRTWTNPNNVVSIDLTDYTDANNFIFPKIYLENGENVPYHRVRHINFCPDEIIVSCDDNLTGTITANTSTYCINTPYNFYLQTTVPINTFAWTINQTQMIGLLPVIVPIYTSTSPTLAYTFTQTGNYTINLVIGYGNNGNNCTANFSMPINVLADCPNIPCIEASGSHSPVIQTLFTELVKVLVADYQTNGVITNNNPQELKNLAPYISHNYPRIYNFSYSGPTTAEYTFSFTTDHPQNEYDVKIVRINAAQTTIGGSPSTITNFEYDSNLDVFSGFDLNWESPSIVSTGNEVRHVDFCPENLIDPCDVHVALVVDESGSLEGDGYIDVNEIEQIRRGLQDFIDRLYANNSITKVSITGMADSDSKVRADNIPPLLVNADNKPLFDDWIAKYGERYDIANDDGISGGSDFWGGALQVVNGFTDVPELVVVFTDGAQTDNTENLQTVIADLRLKSHLYFYGVDNEYYINIDSSSQRLSVKEDPNKNPELSIYKEATINTNSKSVVPSLFTSLSFLYANGYIPVMDEINLLEADYYPYEDFYNLGDGLTVLYNLLFHSGIGCGGEVEVCKDCYSFQPEPGEKYWLSAWVKEDTNIQVKTYTSAAINLVFLNSVDMPVPLDAAGEPIIFSYKASGNIIDGWQRIVGEFEIPSSTLTMRLELTNESNNIPVYFDDVRVHPVNGNMKSFVYDPITFQLMAELDENNYSTRFEYDKEGGLVRVKKETSRGVKTIQETRSGSVIQIQN